VLSLKEKGAKGKKTRIKKTIRGKWKKSITKEKKRGSKRGVQDPIQTKGETKGIKERRETSVEAGKIHHTEGRHSGMSLRTVNYQ